MENEATIYTLDYCPFCQKAKMFLDEHDVRYEEIRCEDDEENKREELTKKFNLSSLATFPQIVINDNYIGGYSDMIEKFEAGQLTL